MPRTVLVTGSTGYIGHHVVRAFLDHGHAVVGSTRDAGRLDAMRQAIAPALSDPEAAGRLSLVELDLTSDAGWSRAMEGVDALIHLASPFPMTQPKDPQDLIRPAVDGARRALTAAADAGVRDVVLTSSIVAVSEDGGQGTTYDETDWSLPDHPATTAYAASKTLAERAAWDIARDRGLRLATINPGLVVGPALGRDYGTSLQVIERLLKGTDPAVPALGFIVSDVRDVALAHLRALEREAAQGHRHIVGDGFYWMREVAELVKEAVPEARTRTREAPNWLLRGMALFDRTARDILPSLGRDFDADTTRMREALGIEGRSAADSIRETALWMRGQGLA